MNADASNLLPLPENTLVGRNHITRFLWTTPIGHLYEITIGSTTHEYGLLILSPACRPASLDALRKNLAPALLANNPCLAKPFACGLDNDMYWIRMELTESVRFSHFSASRRSHENKNAPEEDDARLEDASELLELFHGPVPQNIAVPILGDLIEGLVALHKTGGTLGPLTLRDIGFEEWIHRSGSRIVSKWCNFGLLSISHPDQAALWTHQSDFPMLGRLFSAILCGPNSSSLPTDAWPEWSTFLSTLATPGGFASASDLEDAFQAILDAHRITRHPRTRPENTITPSSTQGTGHLSHEYPRKHSHHSHSSRPAPSSSRIGITLGIIATLGIAAVLGFPFLQKKLSEKAHENDEATPKNESLAESPKKEPAKPSSNVWSLSLDELKTAADDPANLPARMRYAFVLREGSDAIIADPAAANTLAAETLAAIDEHSIGVDPALDRACDFWKGYALLTGLGIEADAPSARILLERCEETHRDLIAKSLLADYYASGAEDGHTLDNDQAALKRWFEIIEESSTPTQFSPDGRRCADKIAAFYFAKRAIPERDQDRYIASIESHARRGHIPSILILANINIEAKIANLDEAAAKKWYGEAATRGNPEGMYHMAWMLERGIASTASDRAAAIWYRRAAASGNTDAMRALARLLRDQRIKNDAGEVLAVEGGKTADEWEAAIVTDGKAPADLPYTTWWLGTQGERFPDPPAVQAR